jgi:hypothetical protein
LYVKVVPQPILALLTEKLLSALTFDMLISGGHLGFWGVAMVIHANEGQK